MDKKRAVREAILSVEKNGVELKEGNHYPVKRLIPGKSAEKPHRIALATFARGCAPEDEVLLVDITLTGSGKKGVLFSTDAIYSSKGLLALRGVPMPLRYGELESVGADEDKWDELILHYRDGRTIKTLTTPYTCYYYAIISAALRALVPEQTVGTEEPAPEPESPSESVPVAEPEMKPASEPVLVAESEMMPASEPVPAAEPEIMPVSEPASVAEPKIIPAPEVVPVQEPEPVTGSEQASVSETETVYVPAPEWEFGSEPETASEIKPEPQQAPVLSAQEMLDLAQACSGRKDFAGALRWYGAALDSGKLSDQAVPVVQYTCGLICCMKENPDARPENGLSWFEKAARGGYAKAQYRCGMMYAGGQGTDQDLGKALSWLEKAAAQDHEDAKTVVRQIKAMFAPAAKKPVQETVGERKTETVQKTAEEKKTETAQKTSGEKKTETVQKTAAEQESSRDEQYAIGMELYQAGDYDRAYPLLKDICRGLKYPDGQAAVGWMFENGRGTEVNTKKAYTRYCIAAQKGSRDGMAGVIRQAVKKESISVAECRKLLEYAKQLDTDEARAAFPVLEQKLAEAQKRKADWEKQKKAEEEQERLFQEGVAAYEEKDFEKAASCFTQAAGLGSITAMSNLGIIYRHENTGIRDLKKSLDWYRKAAEQGDAAAQFNCGVMYRKGEGTEADQERALYWYEKAAEQGDDIAQFICGVMYMEGEGTELNQGKALYWYKKAAEQGHAQSMRNISLLCGQSEGNKWLLKAAEAGDAFSQTLVGEYYSTGGRGFPLDQAEAFRWLLKAARQGAAEAQYNCGNQCAFGKGTKKDERRALYWYEKAAEQGVPQAQYACGDMYSNGKGTEKDKARALYWYEKAAEQGHARSQYSCGVLYYNGDGVAEDLVKARTWFNRAAQQTEDQEVQEKAKKVLRERF